MANDNTSNTLYSNGNAITCSDMLKILFFTDTWISYFIPSPGRTLSAGTLGLPTFVSLNEIQHFMITMSCCMCLVTFCESNLHLWDTTTPYYHGKKKSFKNTSILHPNLYISSEAYMKWCWISGFIILFFVLWVPRWG